MLSLPALFCWFVSYNHYQRPAMIQVKPRAEAKLAAKSHELRTDPGDRRAIVLAEVGNRLVIGSQTAGQPHDLNVATRFTFQATARLHPVEIAVDVKLEKNQRVIERTVGPSDLL